MGGAAHAHAADAIHDIVDCKLIRRGPIHAEQMVLGGFFLTAGDLGAATSAT